jgi:hypothetical protein
MTPEEKLSRAYVTLLVVREIVDRAAQGQPQDWIDTSRTLRRAIEEIGERDDNGRLR